MQIKKSSQVAKATAVISFSIGSLIFILYKLTEGEIFFSIGLLYVFGAAITNLVLLLFLFINLFLVEFEERIELLKNIVLLLLNIPMVYIYLSLI